MKSLVILFLIVTCVYGQLGWMNVSQTIISQGYPCEIHTVETTDGFILTVIRIPHGVNETKETASKNKPVIFLQHGLLDSCDTWVVNSPQESLGFIMADQGFDVYLGNVRGNTYSSVNLKYSGVALWNLVDYDNMIAIDLPTMINTALQISGAQSLVYVGHSQGTLIGFGAFPLQPELAAKVDLFVALAPVAYVGNVESLLLDFAADLDLGDWLKFFGEEEFMPSNWLLKIIGGTLCVFDPEPCSDVIFLLCGYDPSDLNETRVHDYVDEAPAGTSVRNMIHWSQGVSGGKFQMFDYGTSENIQIYGQPTPPQYYLQNFTSPPVAMYTGTKDILADPVDVGILLSQLPASNQPVVVWNEPTYDHLDFIWGMDAHIKIYPSVISLSKKYAKTADGQKLEPN